MAFNKTYFALFLVVLILEILIAVFLKTGFIRNTFGDFLAVILLYCCFKSFWDIEPLKLGIIVLLIAFTVEFLQLTSFLEFLSLENIHIVKIILGSTFHIGDLLAYLIGIITVLSLEYKIHTLWKL